MKTKAWDFHWLDQPSGNVSFSPVPIQSTYVSKGLHAALAEKKAPHEIHFESSTV